MRAKESGPSFGAMPYQANDVWLHTDAGCLPVRRKAWASWNHRLGEDDGRAPGDLQHEHTAGLSAAAALLRQPQSRGAGG